MYEWIPLALSVVVVGWAWLARERSHRQALSEAQALIRTMSFQLTALHNPIAAQDAALIDEHVRAEETHPTNGLERSVRVPIPDDIGDSF